MARNTQLRQQSTKYQYSDYPNDIKSSERISTSKNSADLKGNMKLTLKQLIVFWAGSSLLILLAFYIGFNAGKRSGSISVLDEASDQMVRLELHTPVEPYPAVDETVSDVNIPRDDLVKKPVVEVSPKADIKPKPTENTAPKIDFTAAAALESGRKSEVVKSEFDKKTPVKEKFEEIYPGKDLFAPLPPKVSNIQKKEELQIEEAAKVEEVKIEKPTLQSLTPKNGWYIQIAAAPTEEDGLRYHEKISGKGLSLSLEPASIKNRSFFRVLVGPYQSKAMAMEKRTEIKKQVGTSGEPFVREVR